MTKSMLIKLTSYRTKVQVLPRPSLYARDPSISRNKHLRKDVIDMCTKYRLQIYILPDHSYMYELLSYTIKR